MHISVHVMQPGCYVGTRRVERNRFGRLQRGTSARLLLLLVKQACCFIQHQVQLTALTGDLLPPASCIHWLCGCLMIRVHETQRLTWWCGQSAADFVGCSELGAFSAYRDVEGAALDRALEDDRPRQGNDLRDSHPSYQFQMSQHRPIGPTGHSCVYQNSRVTSPLTAAELSGRGAGI